MAHVTTIDGYSLDDSGEWASNMDNSNTLENIDSSNFHWTSDTVGDNSWKQDCLERGWGPLTKEDYGKRVAEAKSQGTYLPIVHANEFDWGDVTWGSMTGVDSIISDVTTLASSVSKNMANYVYRNSTLTNSSSRIEAYRKMFDIGNRADDIRVVSRTLDSGGWKSLSTKIGVGGSVIAGGINIFKDLNNEKYDDEDKEKAVTVDIVTTVVLGVATVAIAACIPGV